MQRLLSLLTLLVIVFSFSFTSLNAQTPTASGAGDVQTQVLKVGDFATLQVIDDIDIICRCNPDSVGLVTFTGHKDALSNVFFSNEKNRLKIELNLDDNVSPSQIPVITVYTNSLVSVENWGAKTVTVIDPPRGERFKAQVIGNGTVKVFGVYATTTEGRLDTGRGTIELEGTTRSVNLKSLGTGKINAFGLTAEVGNVKNYGTGSVSCTVTDELTVSGMGTGKVYVHGHPKINKRKLSNVKIIEED